MTPAEDAELRTVLGRRGLLAGAPKPAAYVPPHPATPPRERQEAVVPAQSGGAGPMRVEVVADAPLSYRYPSKRPLSGPDLRQRWLSTEDLLELTLPGSTFVWRWRAVACADVRSAAFMLYQRVGPVIQLPRAIFSADQDAELRGFLDKHIPEAPAILRFRQ